MNCKVGDLAIVINALHGDNIGAIVEVLAPGDDPSLLPFWHCKSAGRDLKFTYDNSGDMGIAPDVFFYDFQLRPLRPDEMPEAEQRTTPEPVTA
jgi:hypothetical protein